MPNLFQNPSFSPSVGHTSLFVGFILRCPSHLMGKIAGLFLDDLTWSLQLVIPKRQGLSLLRVGAEVLEGQLISLTWVGLYPGAKQGVRGGLCWVIREVGYLPTPVMGGYGKVSSTQITRVPTSRGLLGPEVEERAGVLDEEKF